MYLVIMSLSDTFTLHKKMKFSIKDFFSKCDQIHSFLRTWSYLLKKSLIKNFIFCAVLIIIHRKLNLVKTVQNIIIVIVIVTDFFCLPHFLLFWFRVRNINIAFAGRQFFCAEKLNMVFMKNWTMTEKGCPFHFESYNKEKLQDFTETSLFNSQVFESFCYCTKRLMGCLCLFIYSPFFVSFCSFFVILGIFSSFFLKHPIVICIQVSSFEETLFF